MTSCITAYISRLESDFSDSTHIARVGDELKVQVSKTLSSLDVNFSLVCTTAEINWKYLYSNDMYALLDTNSLILLAK